MFPKPAFGSNTSSFGSFNAGASTSSPFGGGFKPAGTSAFGATPAFGAAATPQPTTGTGLFGQSSVGTGLFGASTSTAAAPAFGASTSTGFGFGATQPSGMFSSNTSATPLFGAQQQTTSAFGAKPAGFGFGGASTTAGTSGVFGAPATSGGLFGQQTTSLGGGLFGNTGGAFGQQQQPTGTAHVKYNPVLGTDVVVKSGNTQNVSIKHHCITCMKEYENKSLEELRLEDYTAGRKGSTNPPAFGFQQQTETKPLFGGSTFGQPATTSAPSVFGGGGLNTSGFGQMNTFAFGNTASAANTSTNTLFGASKPAFGATATPSTGLFGATTTQAPAFGTTNTSTFDFGANTQNQTNSLFGAKPATSTFGAPAASSFGGFGSGGLFAPKPAQTAPSFSAAPAFGTNTSAFGGNTSTTGLFGGSFKTNTAPSFGFGAAQPTVGLGAGVGTAGGLGSSLGAKPAGTGFPSLTGQGIFGQSGQMNFNTGGNTSLGGGLGGFGNTSSLGGSAFGGFGANNNSGLGNTSLGSQGGNVHEQILALAARPYGDSPLFKDLVPDSTFLSSSEEPARATNPAAVRGVLERSAYRVTSPEPQLRVRALARDKKSLFDGLEESDPSLEGVLGLRPSRKRLVLKPKNDNNAHATENRSIEEVTSTQQDASGGPTAREEPLERARDQENIRGVNTDLEDSSERHSSWLGSSKLPWNDSREKPIDNDPTPRIYPDLDKEVPIQISERRASWLTTKPLRKTMAPPLNPDAVESSVRELRAEPRADSRPVIDDTDQEPVSEDENDAVPRDTRPHPTGVKLTRPGYYTIPSLDDMISYIRPDGRCVVPHLTIGRKNYGNVFYDTEIDVTGLDLDSLVHFLNKEVIIYPDEVGKPPVGHGLNRRAVVTLDRVWPRDKTARRPVTQPDRLIKMDYEGKLRRVCDKHDTKFIEYRPQTGSWVFRVEHFSKYGLTDSDEEDEITPEVLKRQLAQQTLQGAAAAPPTAVRPTGLGGLSAPDDSLFAMQQTSLQLLNGAGKAFEMETEDTSELRTMYPDNLKENVYGVKSPTTELARLEHRQSRSVQLMKASLYNEAEMDDDMSVSTGDQQVPCLRPLETLSEPKLSMVQEEVVAPMVQDDDEEMEIPLRPLILRPHTIILQYHGKIPPFKETIAGRLDAACISDLSVSRSRHSRVGFGPAGKMAFTTSLQSVQRLPLKAVLDQLGAYVRGRGNDDWSERLVVHLSLGAGSNEDAFAPQMDALLSWCVPPVSDNMAALSVRAEPMARRELLRAQLAAAANKRVAPTFGVSNSYCYEVWKLCEALWGADLDNGGVPGTDEQSLVNRHNSLLEWLTAAAADHTDARLKETRDAETEDETDGHSAQIWVLLLGGRVLEACRTARDAGDHNLCVLIAQASGDATFRSLLSRQLSQWRECGAKSLIARNKWRVLELLAGIAPESLAHEHWTTALIACARYICPQIPTLEQVVNTYESLFKKPDGTDGDAPATAGLSAAVVTQNGTTKQVLDLRYELIRARALNLRPRLQPASYTPDPLDYSLCFLLGAWLHVPSLESIAGFAAQLEAGGSWHIAAQALAHHPNAHARSYLIKELLSRHAPAQIKTAREKQQMALLEKLKLPSEWALLGRAARAKYEKLPELEAQLLASAGQWNAAHRVLLEQILPNAVLADKLDSVAPLLEQLESAAKKGAVSGWEARGQALYHYVHVCNEIRDVVSTTSPEDRSSASQRLEALRPRLSAACRAAAALPHLSARHGMARAEMGARLLQLALAAGEPATRLAQLLKALKLPPDCTAAAQYKITSDLAEIASEGCLTTTSPEHS